MEKQSEENPEEHTARVAQATRAEKNHRNPSTGQDEDSSNDQREPRGENEAKEGANLSKGTNRRRLT